MKNTFQWYPMLKQTNKEPQKTIVKQLKLILVKYMLPTLRIVPQRLIVKLLVAFILYFSQDFIILVIQLLSINLILSFSLQGWQHQFHLMENHVWLQETWMELELLGSCLKLELLKLLPFFKQVQENSVDLKLIQLFYLIFLLEQVVIEKIIQLPVL